jgi:hypothetical protein
MNRARAKGLDEVHQQVFRRCSALFGTAHDDPSDPLVAVATDVLPSFWRPARYQVASRCGARHDPANRLKDLRHQVAGVFREARRNSRSVAVITRSSPTHVRS